MSEDLLGKWALNLMLINVSTRRFGRAVRLPEGDISAARGTGVSKSAVSRRFVALSAERMAEWMAADLSELDLLIIQIDGIHIEEDLTLLAAIGIDGDGGKHPLGVIEGATENAAVTQAPLDNLIGRGLLAMLMPERDRQRHTYVLGKSGSGKSELLKLLVYGYLRKPGSATVVVIDPHGDLAEEIARFKEHRKSDRLIYIDPYLDGSGGRMPTLNPFELRDTGPQAIDIAAQSMLEAFKQILHNTALTLQMEALLIPCVSVLLNRRGSTLLDLQRFMNDQRNGDLVRLGARFDNPAQRLFFRDRFYAKTFDPESGGWTLARLSHVVDSVRHGEARHSFARSPCG
jgi:hypothetical protein